MTSDLINDIIKDLVLALNQELPIIKLEIEELEEVYELEEMVLQFKKTERLLDSLLEYLEDTSQDKITADIIQKSDNVILLSKYRRKLG